MSIYCSEAEKEERRCFFLLISLPFPIIFIYFFTSNEFYPITPPFVATLRHLEGPGRFHNLRHLWSPPVRPGRPFRCCRPPCPKTDELDAWIRFPPPRSLKCAIRTSLQKADRLSKMCHPPFQKWVKAMILSLLLKGGRVGVMKD